MTGKTGEFLKVPVYVSREQLTEYRRLALRQGQGITSYMQWVLSQHLVWNSENPCPLSEALMMHKAVAHFSRWNDTCIERHLSRSKRSHDFDEIIDKNRELQAELDMGGE